MLLERMATMVLLLAVTTSGATGAPRPVGSCTACSYMYNIRSLLQGAFAL